MESTLADYDTSTLYHYYETAHGPFRSLSTLEPGEAEAVLERIRQAGGVFASQRPPEYLARRREIEARIRLALIEKGGRPERLTPHYLIVGAAAWVRSWYRFPGEVRIPLRAFKAHALSFTYGDSFPAMRFQDGKPYRGQVYTLAELPGVIDVYGLPQVWNPDGRLGPERYIEAQVWDDEVLREYIQ